MSEFRDKLSALNNAVDNYDDIETVIADTEAEIKELSQTLDEHRKEQVLRMQKIWDCEDELHSLMPENYRRTEPEPEVSASRFSWESQ